MSFTLFVLFAAFSAVFGVSVPANKRLISRHSINTRAHFDSVAKTKISENVTLKLEYVIELFLGSKIFQSVEQRIEEYTNLTNLTSVISIPVRCGNSSNICYCMFGNNYCISSDEINQILQKANLLKHKALIKFEKICTELDLPVHCIQNTNNGSNVSTMGSSINSYGIVSALPIDLKVQYLIEIYLASKIVKVVERVGESFVALTSIISIPDSCGNTTNICLCLFSTSYCISNAEITQLLLQAKLVKQSLLIKFADICERLHLPVNCVQFNGRIHGSVVNGIVSPQDLKLEYLIKLYLAHKLVRNVKHIGGSLASILSMPVKVKCGNSSNLCSCFFNTSDCISNDELNYILSQAELLKQKAIIKYNNICERLNLYVGCIQYNITEISEKGLIGNIVTFVGRDFEGSLYKYFAVTIIMILLIVITHKLKYSGKRTRSKLIIEPVRQPLLSVELVDYQT